ncbi:PAQR family membrane homeostasis protein TrhA [Propionicimonas sp.]|uniref:PAQR family membrane homeostasis protein TrhA n=1 Tax=Propionicimonas sp. TaxID=1955623 RepID=UPI0039E6EDC7
MTAPLAPVLPRPRLRGWLHLGMTPLVLVGGILLIVLSPTLATKLGSAVWLGGSLLLFGTSATYHLGGWRPGVKAALRRWDHANIFVFIAATYTPIALALLTPAAASALLTLIWSVAVVGVLVRVFWQNAPRWIDVACYLLLGWAGVGWMPAFWTSGGPAVVILILLGGLVYTLGAVVYGRRRPDPSPTWFGFHEVFHACTIAAAACHFAAIAVAIFG